MTKLIDIQGTIETDSDKWMDEFLSWLKSRGEVFGGSIHEQGSDTRYIGVSQ